MGMLYGLEGSIGGGAKGGRLPDIQASLRGALTELARTTTAEPKLYPLLLSTRPTSAPAVEAATLYACAVSKKPLAHAWTEPWQKQK